MESAAYGCATITKFTAYLIAEGINFINRLDNKSSRYNLISGGGRKNDYLINCIKENLSKELIRNFGICFVSGFTDYKSGPPKIHIHQ